MSDLPIGPPRQGMDSLLRRFGHPPVEREEPAVWLYVTSAGDVTAYDTQQAALNAARDDPEPYAIERASYFGPQEATGAPPEPEQGQARGNTHTSGTGPRRRSWVSPPGLSYPDGHGAA